MKLPAYAVTEGDMLKLAWGLIVSLVMSICAFYTKATRRELDEMKQGHDKLWEHHDEHVKDVATLQAEGRHIRSDLTDIKMLLKDVNQSVLALHQNSNDSRRGK